MPGEGHNADFSKRVVMHTAAMDWLASPSPSVWRKRLDLAGAAESSRVTSIVRYDANSAGAKHWLVILIGTLVILGGGATAIALLL